MASSSRFTRVVLAWLLVCCASIAAAQPYPSKSVRLIVPFPPGGSTDIVGRTVAQKLQDAWGKSVVVENRPGAGGNIGSEIVARATPDGYTLLLGTVSTHGINPSVYPKMPYDALKDFAPVVLLVRVSNVLMVHPKVKANSVQALIALAKSTPGALAFASSGNGTSTQLSGELFKHMTDTDMIHVPYKGSAPALQDLVSGQVQLMFDNLPSALPQIKAGKVRALAVTAPQRIAQLPQLPTVAEAGVPGFEAMSWFGLLAPAGTPKEIVSALNAEINKAWRAPEMKQRLIDQGTQPAGGTPEEFGKFIKAEIEKWAKVVKRSGATVD